MDDTGRIKLTLWGEDIGKVKNGDTVSVQGAYTTTFRNEVQLNVPKKSGKLEVISSDGGDGDNSDGGDGDNSDRDKALENYKNRNYANYDGTYHSTDRDDNAL